MATIEIRTALMPKYYKDFTCLMGECRFSCCEGNWTIGFDKKDYLKLRRLVVPEEYRIRLNDAVRRIRKNEPERKFYAQFGKDGGAKCLLQDPDGKCSLQKLCGHGALPQVCQGYPRRKYYTVAGLEYSLSPSCEGVLRLLWDLPEGIDFLEESLPGTDSKTLDKTGMSLFFPVIRSLCVDILQERRLPLSSRMILLGISLQKLMDENWSEPSLDRWYASVEGWLNDPTALDLGNVIVAGKGGYVPKLIRSICGFETAGEWIAGEMLDALGVERSTDPDTGEVTRTFLQRAVYEQAHAAMAEKLGDVEYFFENLIVTVAIYTAFPALESPDALWRSYVYLCNVYAYYRLPAFQEGGEEEIRGRLFYSLAWLTRKLLHDAEGQKSIFEQEEYSHDKATLGHMALLVSG